MIVKLIWFAVCLLDVRSTSVLGDRPECCNEEEITVLKMGIDALAQKIEHAEFYSEYKETKSITGGNIADRKSSAVYRYWQKDGKFWRLDTLVSQADGTTIESRLICRPEGWVFLTQVAPKNELVVVAFGGPAESAVRISASNYFPQAAIRYMSLSTIHRILNENSRDDRSKEIKFIKDSQGIVSISLLSPDGTGASIFLDDLSRCVGVQNQMLSSEGFKMERRIKNYFDGFNVPLRQTESISSENGRSMEVEMERLDYSESTIPLGIFAFDAQGVSQSSVWIRRFIMVTVGVAMLGLFLFYRQLRKRV
ncbi:MAG: hypothetical protein ACK553_14850 [Planctomycetota bacterium]